MDNNQLVEWHCTYQFHQHLASVVSELLFEISFDRFGTFLSMTGMSCDPLRSLQRRSWLVLNFSSYSDSSCSIHTFVSLLVLRMPGPGFDSTSPQESSLISSDNLRCEFLQDEKCKPNPIDMNGTYHAFQSEFLLIINPRRGTRTTTIPA